jgi:hypothetical protein
MCGLPTVGDAHLCRLSCPLKLPAYPCQSFISILDWSSPSCGCARLFASSHFSHWIKLKSVLQAIESMIFLLLGHGTAKVDKVLAPLSLPYSVGCTTPHISKPIVCRILRSFPPPPIYFFIRYLNSIKPLFPLSPVSCTCRGPANLFFTWPCMKFPWDLGG